MKSKCLSCANHIKQGSRHTCFKNPNKVIFGEIRFDQKFIDNCSYYEKKEEELKKWIKEQE